MNFKTDNLFNKLVKKSDLLTPVPIFRLNNKDKTKVPKSNMAQLTGNIGPFKLNQNLAPIFATFGCKDPRYYISLCVQKRNILALIDSRSTLIYVEKTAANLLGDFDDTNVIMTAANKNSVKVDGIKSMNYALKGTEKQIPTTGYQAQIS